jgi:hypothetical protein
VGRVVVAYDEGSERVDDSARAEAAAQQIWRYQQATRRAAGQLALDRAVVASGLIGSSAGVLRGFRQAGVPVVTIESWGLQPYRLIWNVDQPAVHFDYAGWFEVLGELDAPQKALIRSYLAFQEDPDGARSEPWQEYRSAQRSAVSRSELPPELAQLLASTEAVALLGTNVIGDSATLGKETLFPSQVDWLDAVIAWFSERPDWGLAIRIHPEERLNRTPLPLGPLVRPRIEKMANACLVDADVSLNTFALARHIKVGLLWVSNLGVDLVARDVPVIAAARSTYHGLGITEEPSTVAAYFDRLEAALSGQLRVTDAHRHAAYRQMYVLTQLLSLPGNPLRRATLYPTMAVDDEYRLMFEVLAGSKGRAECLEINRRTVARLMAAEHGQGREKRH